MSLDSSNLGQNLFSSHISQSLLYIDLAISGNNPAYYNIISDLYFIQPQQADMPPIIASGAMVSMSLLGVSFRYAT